MCRKHHGSLLTLCVVLIHLKYQKLVSGNEVPRDVDGGIVASPHKCETKPPPSASGFSFVHIIHTLNYHCVVWYVAGSHQQFNSMSSVSCIKSYNCNFILHTFLHT